MTFAPWPYGSDRPWGWHLRSATKRNGSVVILDEEGNQFESVRDIFWRKRLGMSDSDPRIRDEQLEFILAVLASKRQDVIGTAETIHSLFYGSSEHYRFYFYWLYSIGLTAGGIGDPLAAGLSEEGMAVLRMLAATRPLSVAAIPVGTEGIAAFGPPDTDAECSREKFKALEGKARRLPFVFVRERLFQEPTISLLHRNPRDPIPMARTLWSMPFHDEASRDRMYLWLHGRLDRWTGLGEVARREGANALTQQLLALIMLASNGPPGWSTSSEIRLAISYRPGGSDTDRSPNP